MADQLPLQPEDGVVPADYDSPWKEILEAYFQEFIEFFFPVAGKDIDWSQGYEFLDKEFQRVVRDAELGRRLADKLVRLYRQNGEEAWVLVHIEVQGTRDVDFPKRMFSYNYRIFDRYDRPVVSLAVLADEAPRWRPDAFGYSLWDCEMGIRFPVAKLLDYAERWAELEAAANPFAVVVMAHLKAQATRRDPDSRLDWKLRLVRGLYDKGFDRREVLELFRFIDWLLVLPAELERGFEEELHRYEREKNMPYITSIERSGIKKGIQQGLQQGLQQKAHADVLEVLETRFGVVPQSVTEALARVTREPVLSMLHKRAVLVESFDMFLDDLHRALS